MNALGDALTSDQLSIADDLYYQRIPETWRRAAGAAAPPSLQSLNIFISDIVARSTHFERILVLVGDFRAGIGLPKEKEESRVARFHMILCHSNDHKFAPISVT